MKVGDEKRDAKNAISGLTLSKENYETAVDILKDRLGNSQEVTDLHNDKMINLHVVQATNKICSYSDLFNSIGRHSSSPEVLKQNINQDVFVSMIHSILPQDVLLQSEFLYRAKTSGLWKT